MSEYNRLVLLADMRDRPEARYQYALCHGCGIVYATERPSGETFDYLLSRFNEILGRADKIASNILLHDGEITDELRTELTREACPWWELEERAAENNGRVVGPMLRDMQSEAADLAFILPYARIREGRILHIRSKSGFLADMLHRVFGARQCDVITIFPVNQLLIEHLYGLRAAARLDFERFSIPFEEKYDLIIANHMLTHALEPMAYLKEVRRHLRKGGHLYMRHEACDLRMYGQRENLIGELRPFHFQQFDERALRRAVEHAGFKVVSAGYKYPNSKRSEMVVVAEKLAEPAPPRRIGRRDREPSRALPRMAG